MNSLFIDFDLKNEYYESDWILSGQILGLQSPNQNGYLAKTKYHKHCLTVNEEKNLIMQNGWLIMANNTLIPPIALQATNLNIFAQTIKPNESSNFISHAPQLINETPIPSHFHSCSHFF